MNALPDHSQFTRAIPQSITQRMTAIIASEAAPPHFSIEKARLCRRTQRQLRNAAFTLLRRHDENGRRKSFAWIAQRFGTAEWTVSNGIKALARDLAKGCLESRNALARMEALL